MDNAKAFFNKNKKTVIGLIAVIVIIIGIFAFINRSSPEVKFLTQSNMNMHVKATKSTFLVGNVSATDDTTIPKLSKYEAKKAYDDKAKTLTFDNKTINHIMLNNDKTKMTGNYSEDGTKVDITITHVK